jgi:hypothetical protein
MKIASNVPTWEINTNAATEGCHVYWMSIPQFQHYAMLSPSLKLFGSRHRSTTSTSIAAHWRKKVRSGVIRRSGNEKRGRGRPNLTWEESVKSDLKDWCITKELALDRRE